MENLRFKKGEVFFGRYKLDERLGEGGMGQVWAAADLDLERRVALKIIHLKYADHPDYRARFKREAKAVARLKHPNIVQLYTAEFMPDGSACMVMELIDGRTLRAYIEQVRRVDLVSAVYIAIQIADALGLAHQAGVWHRDIKPENIIVSDEGHAWLLDFGICIQRSAPEERPMLQGGKRHGTGRLGTLAYTPPEEALNQTADQRGDFYQLGVALYEMLAGRKPYPGVNETSETDMLTAHAYAEPQPLVEVVPGCPAWVWRIVARLLEKDPDARYDDVDELIRDLRAGLESVPKDHAMAREIDQHQLQQDRKKAFADKRASLPSVPSEDAVSSPDGAPAVPKAGGTEPMMGGWASTKPLGNGFAPPSPYSPRRANPEPAPPVVTGPLPEGAVAAAPPSAPLYILSPPAIPPPSSSLVRLNGPASAPAAVVRLNGPAPTPPFTAPPAMPLPLPAPPASSAVVWSSGPALRPPGAPASPAVPLPAPPSLPASPAVPLPLPGAPPPHGVERARTGPLILGSLAVGLALAAAEVVVLWPRLAVPPAREDRSLVASASASVPVAPPSVVPVASTTAAPVSRAAPVEVAVTTAAAATPAPVKAARSPSQPVKRSPPKPTVNIGGKATPADEVPLFEMKPVRKVPIGGRPEY